MDWKAAEDGRKKQIEVLWHRFKPELRAYVNRKMGPRARRWDDPEDLVQEVLWEVLASSDRLAMVRDESHLRARLFRTAKYRILDRLRRRQRDAGVSAIPQGKGESGSENHEITRLDQDRMIRELVERLPDSHGEVVRLCALEGLSFAEVAERLGILPGTVRKRYNRARTLLETKLRERRHGG